MTFTRITTSLIILCVLLWINVGFCVYHFSLSLTNADLLLYIKDDSSITLTNIERLPGLPVLTETLVRSYPIADFDCSNNGHSIVFATMPYLVEDLIDTDSDAVTVGGQLYVIDPNGRVENVLRQVGYSYETPDWLPDREHIAFVGLESSSGQSNLFILDTLTREVIQLTHGDAHYDDPDVSPDGTQILSAAMFSTADGDNVWQIVVVNLSGEHRTVRTASGNVSYAHPIWSPDGQQIAFAAANEGSAQTRIYIMNRDGTSMRLLIEAPRARPFWISSGLRVLFGLGARGQFQLYLVDPLRDEIRPLNPMGVDSFHLCWLP